jgi:ABC-2 type transport system ATP-binding protein
VLLSSHILSEVEALCDRVSIIKDGHVVESGTLAQLRHLTRTRVKATLRGPVPHDLRAVPGVHDLVAEGPRLVCDVDTTRLDDLLRRLTTVGVETLTSTPPTLEELFLRHYATDITAPDPSEASSAAATPSTPQVDSRDSA